MSETIKHYLRDFIYILKEEHQKLKEQSNNSEFDEGSKFTYYKVLELMKNQAESFDIDLELIGFHDYEKYIKANEGTGHNKR